MVILIKPHLSNNARRLPGGVHYSWIIVAVLALVQIVGSSISMSAGVMVPPLNDPDGAFRWNIGIIGAALAVYYLVGALFAPVSGRLGDRYGPRRLLPVYGIEMMGAMFGHAIATVLGGLVIYVTGSFNPALGLSMAFSFVGVLVILNLESTKRVLIPHWEESLPAEARATTQQPRAAAVRAALVEPASGDG